MKKIITTLALATLLIFNPAVKAGTQGGPWESGAETHTGYQWTQVHGRRFYFNWGPEFPYYRSSRCHCCWWPACWPGHRYSYWTGNYPYNYYYYDTYPPQVGNFPIEASTEMAVQMALSQRGFYQGKVDGRMGPQTVAAIRAYQASRGMAATGVIDTRLLRSLDLPR